MNIETKKAAKKSYLIVGVDKELLKKVRAKKKNKKHKWQDIIEHFLKAYLK